MCVLDAQISITSDLALCRFPGVKGMASLPIQRVQREYAEERAMTIRANSRASASTAIGARRPRRSISTRSCSGTRTRRETLFHLLRGTVEVLGEADGDTILL